MMFSALKSFSFLFIVTFITGSIQTDTPVWSMDSPEEIETFGHDGSGATFKLHHENAVSGSASLKVIPSGSSQETKIEIPLYGEKVSQWKGHNTAVIRIYRSASDNLNPDHFHLGIANVTGGSWSWVGGTAWDESELQPGWNEITFTLPEEMQNLQADYNYSLFLAFSTYMPPREDGVRIPLYENFLIDSISTL